MDMGFRLFIKFRYTGLDEARTPPAVRPRWWAGPQQGSAHRHAAAVVSPVATRRRARERTRRQGPARFEAPAPSPSLALTAATLVACALIPNPPEMRLLGWVFGADTEVSSGGAEADRLRPLAEGRRSR